MIHNSSSKPLSVKAGIMTAREIKVFFNTPYRHNGKTFYGRHCFSYKNLSEGDHLFEAGDDAASFNIDNVTIGKDFHWQRQQTQTFRGSLLLRVKDRETTVINILPVEQYLASVISSEMSPEAFPEFLKAHAVISRSWVMARILGKDDAGPEDPQQKTEDDDTRIRWYDHMGHEGFDVCADDHCQRYQGILRINQPAIEAVDATAGEVLTFDGKICDARFSKCCGGAFETFENCWQPTPIPYLRPGRDFAYPSAALPDLSREENARRWIKSAPEAFCNTADKDILRQVLNDFDRPTTDFFRWKLRYTNTELSEIIKSRSGIDFGKIISLTPLERGASGRIVRLKIKGTLRGMTIGKELEIRRTLSKSHLYSSAFTVEEGAPDVAGAPSEFTLTGAGWGHGVGLCQIGAAVMASKGYDYRQILRHYYPGTSIEVV